MSESPATSATSEASKPPSELAFDELAHRIAGDSGVDSESRQALLDDLASENPAALSKFREVVAQRGKDEAKSA
jgi:hypothetical protein